ncbi:MAG: asparaginase [Epsilonproteobacteria bacterium]|nr:asparaginase [Campylobacterota bacterium]
MIEIINTGGTFNKRYNPISGELEVPNDYKVIKEILKRSCFINQKIHITQIISKDSLEFTKKDRQTLLNTIQNTKSNKIVVVHGTDTMHKSAKFVNKFIKNKIVIFTGAMKPYEIEQVEATSNLMLALGFAQNAKHGVYIAMHGIVAKFHQLKKNYQKGIFIATSD